MVHLEHLSIEDLGRCSFRHALARMSSHLDLMRRGGAGDRLMVFESDPVITLGRDTRRRNLLASASVLLERGLPVMEVDRGGDATWHGPGQLVLFPLVDLRRRGWDVYSFIDLLIESIGDTLARFGLAMDPPDGKIGVWVGGHKLASLGLRQERGIVSHGLSLNVDPGFEWMDFINPCGDASRKVTSLKKLLGECPAMETVKETLLDRLTRRLGREASGLTADRRYKRTDISSQPVQDIGYSE